MPRAPSPSRERIVREAECLIHLGGYHCTSLDDIARRCGMTKANLLHHFLSKEALGLAVLELKCRDYQGRCVDPVFSEGRDPAEAVRELFASAGRFFRGNGCRAGCLVGNMALEMSDLNERFRERTARFFADWAKAVERCLRRSQARGRRCGRLRPKDAAEAVIGLYEGAVMLARTRRDPGIFDRAGRAAQALVAPAGKGRFPARKT